MTVIKVDTTHISTSVNIGLPDLTAEYTELLDNINYAETDWDAVTNEYPITTTTTTIV
jgi:hypothetical protein